MSTSAPRQGMKCLLHLRRRSISRIPTNRTQSSDSKRTTTRHVKIVEVGPRDGLQNESQFVNTDDKITFITKLADAGCNFIEATSFVSPKWIPAMADAEEVMEGLKHWKSGRQMEETAADGSSRPSSPTFSCLVPNLRGFERALEGGADEVAIFAAASEAFSQKNINCSIDESINRFQEVADAAAEHNIPLRGYVSCVLGCPYQGSVPPSDVARVSERLVDLGCKEISLGDTIGVGTPGETVAMLNEVKAVVDTDTIAVHFHDTYGQALANIHASLGEGISTVDSSVSGLGGCPYAAGASGNVATEDVVYMLNGLGIRTGIDLDRLMDAGSFICNVLGSRTRSKAAMALAVKEGRNASDEERKSERYPSNASKGLQCILVWGRKCSPTMEVDFMHRIPPCNFEKEILTCMSQGNMKAVGQKNQTTLAIFATTALLDGTAMSVRFIAEPLV